MEIVKLCKRPDLAEAAAGFFAEHWSVPQGVYLESIRAYIDNPKGIPRWYVVCEGGRIAAGAGVIDNDFHERKDLRPVRAKSFPQPRRGAEIARFRARRPGRYGI